MGKTFGLTLDRIAASRLLALAILLLTATGFTGDWCRLPGCGAAPAWAETPSPIVTTTADGVADDGVITLREAINYANAHPGTSVRFNIPAAQAVGGVFTIAPTSQLPVITASNTIIDGSTQTSFTGDTNPNGPEVEIDGINVTTAAVGLLLEGANATVRNLVIHSFQNDNLRISGAAATGNTVQGCFIGLDASGTTASGDPGGVLLDSGANHNTIGGTSTAARNVIAGNVWDLTLQTASYNTIQGNYVGLQADGSDTPIGEPSVTSGVHLNTASSHNTIGGTMTGARNVINAYGITQYDSGSTLAIWNTGSDYNVIQGNYVGTDVTGTVQIGTSSYGVLCTDNAQHNLVGGTSAATRNVVGAHPEFGIATSFSDNNTFQGNYVGIDPSGNNAVGAGEFGIVAYGCSNTLIGGTTFGARNVVAGNLRRGILIETEQGIAPTINTRVQGNFIGTNAAGTAPVGVQLIGVAITGDCRQNIVGLDLNGNGLANRIAYNGNSTDAVGKGGVRVLSLDNVPFPTGNTIRGNAIYSNGSNGGLGINLQTTTEADNSITPNDAQDVDDEANGLQNFPVLSSALATGSTAINGTLNSTPNASFIIDFYRNLAPGTSGYGEGHYYLGSTTVTTDANGDGSFSYNASGNLTGQYISATATAAATGDTSEFSADVQVVSGLFSISGRVATSSGTGMGGVNVSISPHPSTAASPVASNTAGYFTLTNVPNGTYTITPARTGYAFTPTSRTVIVNNGAVTGQNFTATPAYSVSGRIATSSGIAIGGVTVQLDAGPAAALTNSAGYYTFPSVPNGSHTLTPNKSGVTFTPATKSVTVSGANVSGQNFIGN
jgi:CSLREA domain-containing protein